MKPRRSNRKTKFKKSIALAAALALIVGVLAVFILLRSPLKRVSIDVNGQTLTYHQGGDGPSLVILEPPESDLEWKELARALSPHFRLTVLPNLAPDSAMATLTALALPPSILVGHSTGAPAALAIAGQRKDWAIKLILLSPVINDSELNRVNGDIPQSSLILWGRNDKRLKPESVMRLNSRLRNSQFSFHPKAGEDLVEEQFEWVADKLRNFISITR